jgi:hypothetical protein
MSNGSEKFVPKAVHDPNTGKVQGMTGTHTLDPNSSSMGRLPQLDGLHVGAACQLWRVTYRRALADAFVTAWIKAAGKRRGLPPLRLRVHGTL